MLSVSSPTRAPLRPGALLRSVLDLFARIGAAQRCAYAVELGRLPARRDIDLLGLDAASLRAALRA